VQQLSSGTTVALIEDASSRQIVARDGEKLGYIEEEALLILQ
jgi:hypothetical protein